MANNEHIRTVVPSPDYGGVFAPRTFFKDGQWRVGLLYTDGLHENLVGPMPLPQSQLRRRHPDVWNDYRDVVRSENEPGSFQVIIDQSLSNYRQLDGNPMGLKLMVNNLYTLVKNDGYLCLQLEPHIAEDPKVTEQAHQKVLEMVTHIFGNPLQTIDYQRPPTQEPEFTDVDPGEANGDIQQQVGEALVEGSKGTLYIFRKHEQEKPKDSEVVDEEAKDLANVVDLFFKSNTLSTTSGRRGTQ
jgi:hypothetical protein